MLSTVTAYKCGDNKIMKSIHVFGLVIFLYSCLVGRANGETDDEFKQTVLAELRELKQKVALLEKRPESCEHKGTGKQTLSHSKRETSFFPENDVAFSARVSQHVRNLTAHQPIVFGTTLTNSGNYYNNSTGVFYVPVTGMYLLFVNVLSEVGNYIETELVVNGNALAEVYSGGGKFNGAGSNLVIVHLQKGDNVWLKVHFAWSSDMNVHCCFSTFSGVLLRESSNPAQVVG